MLLIVLFELSSVGSRVGMTIFRLNHADLVKSVHIHKGRTSALKYLGFDENYYSDNWRCVLQNKSL